MNNTIFCRTCGKELSSSPYMCPNCGTPVNGAPDIKPKTTEPAKTGTEARVLGLSVVAFILSTVAFITGIIFGAFFFVFSASAILLYIISATTILPALAGIAIGAYLLCSARNELSNSAKTILIIAIVFSAIALLFLFIGGCVIVAA